MRGVTGTALGLFQQSEWLARMLHDDTKEEKRNTLQERVKEVDIFVPKGLKAGLHNYSISTWTWPILVNIIQVINL